MYKISVVLFIIAVMLVSSSAYAGITERVSVSSDGVQGNYESGNPSISADGRFVAFESVATNLVPGDTNGNPSWIWGGKDIFVYDRQTGITERVSVSSEGVQSNGSSESPSISADGRFVAFASGATNLISDYTIKTKSIFVHDRQTGQTECVSISSDGSTTKGQNPFISADGKLVVFSSGNPSYYVYNRQTREIKCISISRSTDDDFFKYLYYTRSAISVNGRFVVFESVEKTLVPDARMDGVNIFVHDMDTDITEQVSVSSDGSQMYGDFSQPSISADGRYVAFDNGSIILLHDRQTGKTERVSNPNDGSPFAGNDPSISADGRFIAFTQSFYAYNGIGVYDTKTGKTECISESSSGMQAKNGAGSPSMSADGKFVAFSSSGDNLVSGDTNNKPDVFVHELTYVQGKIELSDFEGDITAVPLTIDLGNGFDPFGLNLDSEGKFSIWDPPCGTFDIRIKASHWLAKTITDIAINGDADLGTTCLINGDVVETNEIDFSDINAVRAAIGSFPGDPNWNALADVDGNGEVDFTDINIVRSNYGMVGE